MHNRLSRLFARALLMSVLQISGLSYAQAPDVIPAPLAATPAINNSPAALPVVAAPMATTPTPKLDAGNTAWMLTSTALVLFMTLPGIALFYGGMVRKKNVLSMCSQIFATAVIVTLTWTLIGYSLSMRPGTGFIGGLDRLFMDGMLTDNLAGITGANIPETVFSMFQLTFAIITAALIPGAFAERFKFSALCGFMFLWSIFIYAPIAHWVWEPGGWLAKMGVLDYAGGTVVHVNAGIAGLVCAVVLGRRNGFGREPMSPHNLVLTIMGAGMLWVGWFGFNAGSAIAADTHAGMAMLVTQIAAAMAAFAWMCVEWAVRGRPSALGIVSGAVAGLVAITPASGFVSPKAALCIGLAAGVVCYLGATSLKRLLGYDDSLDVFGIHGIGGAVGAILTGVFGTPEGGNVIAQVWDQCIGVSVTIVYSGFGTFLILAVLDILIGLRVPEEAEVEGLDRFEHGEHIE